MPPVLLALVDIVLLLVAFWATRSYSNARKRGLRAVTLVVALILLVALSPDARAAAVSGEYLVYFGVVGAIVYLVATRVFA